MVGTGSNLAGHSVSVGRHSVGIVGLGLIVSLCSTSIGHTLGFTPDASRVGHGPHFVGLGGHIVGFTKHLVGFASAASQTVGFIGHTVGLAFTASRVGLHSTAMRVG